jgi:hypothetical protein
VSGESQSIRKLHVSDARRAPGGWLPGCICGWEGSIILATYHMADIDGRHHAREQTLAQIRQERAGGPGRG